VERVREGNTWLAMVSLLVVLVVLTMMIWRSALILRDLRRDRRRS